MSFLKSFSFFAPSYQVYLKLGFKARTFNGDFILSREYQSCTVHIHQSVEPYNKKLSRLIDFEIEDACVVFEFKTQADLSLPFTDQVRQKFDYCYDRENYLFLMNREMDFNDSKLEKIISDLHIVLSDLITR